MKIQNKVPDDMGKFMEIFTELCEDYADEVDGGNRNGVRRWKLLDFCHAYAYKVNGVKEWK